MSTNGGLLKRDRRRLTVSVWRQAWQDHTAIVIAHEAIDPIQSCGCQAELEESILPTVPRVTLGDG
jgi:hypothetical protein